MSKRRHAERRQVAHPAQRQRPTQDARGPQRSRTTDQGRPGTAADRRPLVLGVLVVVIVAVAGIAFLLRPGGSAATAWTRLGTEDVHALTFVDDDPQRLLFGHHGGILASEDGGRTWTALGTNSDAMGLAAGGANGAGSIVIAGHLVLIESRDGGRSWSSIPADLPDLDIHGFTRDPADPNRMWAYLAIGGLWESSDGGRAWERVHDGNVVHPIAVAAPGGTRLYGVTTAGPSRSDDGGRTWAAIGSPDLFPLASLAATPDGSVLVAGGPDGLARSDDGGMTWRMLAFQGEPASVAVARGGSTIAVVTRSTEFYRSDDGGSSWPGP